VRFSSAFYCVKVNRLRQDLKWAKDQLQLLTSRLSTNVSWVDLHSYYYTTAPTPTTTTTDTY